MNKLHDLNIWSHSQHLPKTLFRPRRRIQLLGIQRITPKQVGFTTPLTTWVPWEEASVLGPTQHFRGAVRTITGKEAAVGKHQEETSPSGDWGLAVVPPEVSAFNLAVPGGVPAMNSRSVESQQPTRLEMASTLTHGLKPPIATCHTLWKGYSILIDKWILSKGLYCTGSHKSVAPGRVFEQQGPLRRPYNTHGGGPGRREMAN